MNHKVEQTVKRHIVDWFELISYIRHTGCIMTKKNTMKIAKTTYRMKAKEKKLIDFICKQCTHILVTAQQTVEGHYCIHESA
jgi:hypothetical protein